MSKKCKFQPDFIQWRCPKCGERDNFYVTDTIHSSDDDFLWDDDYVTCYACGYGANGKKATKDIAKKLSMVTCSCCKGKGMVKK